MTTTEAQFETELTLDDAARFAEVSGDWNPLHTDPMHAVSSVYGRQVLHGAFSAGLVSRLAGMYLPGRDCLLYGMRLRFVVPILPPVRVAVRGKVVSGSVETGRVQATISDVETGAVYVDASYEFGHHRMIDQCNAPPESMTPVEDAQILVTGATGGVGSALLRRLGKRGRPLARSNLTGHLGFRDRQTHHTEFHDGTIAGIVHCGWPMPDNRRLLDLEDPERAIDYNIAAPLRHIQALAALLARFGCDNAPLVLIGSTFAKPGRHYFRSPLYSIAKSTVPAIVEVLALELASTRRRCFGVVFDVLDGGMNKGMTAASRLANADRSPWGQVATVHEAAEQIIWLLENDSKLLSGAMLTLAAGAVP